MAIFTKVYVCGPESRATLEANRTLGDDGRVAAQSHQVMDLKKDLKHKYMEVPHFYQRYGEIVQQLYSECLSPVSCSTGGLFHCDLLWPIW